MFIWFTIIRLKCKQNLFYFTYFLKCILLLTALGKRGDKICSVSFVPSLRVLREP